jgi:hypothetical protein
MIYKKFSRNMYMYMYFDFLFYQHEDFFLQNLMTWTCMYEYVITYFCLKFVRF